LDRMTAIATLCVAAVLILPIPPSRMVGGSRLFDGESTRQGPEVLASNSPDGGALRCEPSVAVFRNVIVVAWNDSYSGAHGMKNKAGVSVGWAISLDRGQTFKFGGYLPQDSDGNLLSGADSWLAADGEGNFYLQVMSWESPHVIEVYYMDHRGLGRWQKMTIAASGEYADKPAMSVGSAGQIGIAYSDTNPARYSIYFVKSSDGGRSWSKPIELSASENRIKLGAGLSVRGSEIVATWMEGAKSDVDEIWGAISEDAGRTFSKPSMIYKLKQTPPSPEGYRFGLGYPAQFLNFAWLACGPALSGKSVCYLACAEGVGKGSRVLFFTLPPGGKTWSRPATVGDSPDQAIKVMPSVAMVASRPAVLYYDRRNGPEGALTDVYLSILGKGAKFEDLKLNSVSTDWTKTPGDKQYAPIQRNFGDYITLASEGRLLVAAWTDGRNGSPRIYVRTIEFKGTGE
jgi:hypothetical protein